VIAALRAGAVVLVASVAAYTVVAVDASRGAAGVALAGAVCAAAGVVRWAWAAWPGVALVATGYVAAVAVRGGDVDPGAPAVAAILFLVAEVPDVAASGPTGAAARLWHSLAVCFAAAFLAGALLIAGTASRTGGAIAVAGSALCGAIVLWGLAAFAGGRARNGA
jgi:hypothetical protein